MSLTDEEIAAFDAKLAAEFRALREERDALRSRLDAIDAANAAHEAEIAKHASYCEIRWNTSADCDCGYPAEAARALAKEGT